MAEIGSFALLLALALSVYTFLAGIVALAFQKQAPLPSGTQPYPRAGVASSEDGSFAAILRRISERIGETARRAGIATFAAVFLAAVFLVICAFRDDFTIAYIFHHSNRDLPAPYKFSTLWSGQEASLLFCSLLLAAYGFVLRLRYKTDPRLFAYASVLIPPLPVFFLFLLTFPPHPFAVIYSS